VQDDRVELENESSQPSNGSNKRKSSSESSSQHDRPLKRLKTEAERCKLTSLREEGWLSPLLRDRKQGKLNVYLEAEWRDRWCQCEKVRIRIDTGLFADVSHYLLTQCSPLFEQLPYFLTEEDVFEPPEDTESREFISSRSQAIT
jgi:hypothetical protein